MRGTASNHFTIFLDDGGVMNDNDLRGPQWERLVAEYVAPRLGGDHERWMEANRVVFARQWHRFEAWQQTIDSHQGQVFFDTREEQERWLAEMCEEVGIERLPPDECYRLAIETQQYVTPRVRSTFPGAIDAIRALHAAGHTLSTASGHPSSDLELYLTTMGVRDRFTAHLYGPEVIHTPKHHPEFYRRVFEHAGVVPGQALVVDDDARAIERAKAAGAATVLVAPDGSARAVGQEVIAGLAELPALLKRWERRDD